MLMPPHLSRNSFSEENTQNTFNFTIIMKNERKRNSIEISSAVFAIFTLLKYLANLAEHFIHSGNIFPSDRKFAQIKEQRGNR